MNAIDFNNATPEQQQAEIAVIRARLVKTLADNPSHDKFGIFAFLTKTGEIQLYKGDYKYICLGSYIEVNGKWSMLKSVKRESDSGGFLLLGNIETGRALLIEDKDYLHEHVSQYFRLIPNKYEFTISSHEQREADVELIKSAIDKRIQEMNHPERFRLFLTESGELVRRGGKDFAEFRIGDECKIDDENSVCVFAGSQDIDMIELSEGIADFFIPTTFKKDCGEKVLVYRNDCFMLLSDYDDRHIPKNAGMHFSFNTKTWYTDNVNIANKFREFADRKALKKLNQILASSE
jgi:hypothetical protein